MNDINIVFRLLINDIRNNFHRNKWKYILLSLLLCYLSIMNSIQFEEPFSTIELFYLNFKDVGFINNYELSSVPTIWMIINVFVIFICGDALYYDNKLNVYLLLRVQKIHLYWFSKALFIILNILSTYLVLFFVTYITSLVFNLDSLHWNASAAKNISDLCCIHITEGKFLIIIFTLYTLTSISLTLIHIFLSFNLNSNYSFLIICIVICLSIFINHPLLPAIHSMLLKHTIFDPSHHLTLIYSICYNILLSIFLFIATYFSLLKKDLI